MDAHLIEVESTLVVGTVGEVGEAKTFFALEQRLAGRLIESIQNANTSRLKNKGMNNTQRRKQATKARSKARIEPPSKDGTEEKPKPGAGPNAEAVARFGDALDAIDSGDTSRARKQLSMIVKDSPKFSAASSALAKLAE